MMNLAVLNRIAIDKLTGLPSYHFAGTVSECAYLPALCFS